MLKRLLPLLLIVLLVVPAGFFFLARKDKLVSSYQSQAMFVVPDDAVWIIESRSVHELLKALIQSDPLFPALEQIGNIKPHLRAFQKIDSLISRNSRLKEIFGHNPAVLSLHQTGKTQYQFLMILETWDTSISTIVGDLFSELCGHQGQWSPRMYNGQQINRITFGADAWIPGLSLAGNKEFLVFSPSPILLENAVRQMNQERTLHKNSAFNKLSGSSGKDALANIYVNLKVFPAWLSRWMNPAVKRNMEMFTRYGDWASLDLTIRNDAIWLNGFALEGDTLRSYLSLFKDQMPRKFESEQYLPSTTAAYFTLGVEKPAQYLKGLSDYLGGGEQGRKRQRIIDHAGAITGEDVVKVWSDLGFRELTVGYLCGVADGSVRPVALVAVKNTSLAAGKLINGKIADASVRPGSKQVPAKIFRVEDQHDIDIYPMPFEGLPEVLGGSLFSAVTGRYFACADKFLVLADEIETVEEVLRKYSLNKTLVNDAVYLSLAGLVSTRSNVTFFAIPYKARPLLQEILNSKALAASFANDQFLLKTGAVGFQFNSSNGMSLHNLFVSFAEIDFSKPQTIWESRLDAKVYTRPVIVLNPITQAKEIMVQDEAANLYLLNSSGRILWKKNINERINSEIFQIDVMKNGQLQYLFSTRDAIHLLDRTGEYLPKFPLILKLPATSGMALIDFDRNRDYRILIACSDNNIYGFDKNGLPLKGWSFGPAAGPITQPVQFFKIQNKDYLAINDPLKVYILDRKGAVKVSPENDFPISPNSRIVYKAMASGKGPRFLLSGIDGTVYTIFLDGTVESKKFGEYSPDHYFSLDDLNKDGLDEITFIDRNKLDVFNQSGDKLYSRKLDGNVTTAPGFYLLTGKMKKIGLTVPSKNEILLIDNDGSLYNGFPLDGQTSFTIGDLDKASPYQNLLVGSNEAYLFNYAIK